MESEEIKALRREQKNATIKSSIKATKARHALMIPVSVELKLDLKSLNNEERHKLCSYFVESKWLKNYLLALPPDEFRAFDTSTRDIHSLDKEGNKVPRQLEMPAKFLQSVYKDVRNDMKSLAKKKEKTGRKNGSLKFCSQYRSIDLNQYGNTHRICYGDEGDRNGRYRNTVHIAGIKRPIRAFGMDQMPKDGEAANAKVI